MIFSLAIKGLRARPLGTVCAVLVIALAAAMLFSVFSFGDAVYDYIYAVETADAGDSDILIAGKAGNRLADLTPLEALGDEIEKIVPTLTVYALEKDSGQYVKLRGFRKEDFRKEDNEPLSSIEVVEGDPSELGDPGGDNSVVISEAASEALGKGVGDRLVLGERTFFVAAVARASARSRARRSRRRFSRRSRARRRRGGDDARRGASAGTRFPRRRDSSADRSRRNVAAASFAQPHADGRAA